MLTEARKKYLDTLSIGNIVAFKNGNNMFSGMVVEIVNKYATIQTPNGSIYYVNIQDIAWIKNGSRWPVGIFNALKRSKKG